MAAGGRWLPEANSEACEVRDQARHVLPQPSQACVTAYLLGGPARSAYLEIRDIDQYDSSDTIRSNSRRRLHGQSKSAQCCRPSCARCELSVPVPTTRRTGTATTALTSTSAFLGTCWRRPDERVIALQRLFQQSCPRCSIYGRLRFRHGFVFNESIPLA